LIVGISLFAPAFYYGFAGNLLVHQEWIDSLSRSTPALLTSQDNVSLLAFLTKRALDPGIASLVFAGLVVGLVFAVLAFVRRGRDLPRPIAADAALLLLLIPLISPLGWDYTFLSSILAVALVLDRFREFPKAARALLAADLAVIGLSLYDVLGRRAYGVFMSWSVLTVCFLLLAGFLFYLRIARKA
jgi:hypothetical protein